MRTPSQSTGDTKSAAAAAAGKIAYRAILSAAAVDTAERRWTEIRDAIINGASEDGDRSRARLTNVLNRYLSLKRLGDEARRLVLSAAAPESVSFLYAIDPHLILGYCTFWTKTNFLTFDFTESEWNQDESRERTEFIVYLIGSILRMENLICLQAGREEISDMLGYFFDTQERHKNHATQLREFEVAIKAISESVALSKGVVSSEKLSTFILEKFEALVATGGIPLMNQGLSAARLTQILKAGYLKNTFSALEGAVGKDGQAELAHAQSLFRSFLMNEDLVRDARTSLYEAYLTFARSMSLGDRSENFISTEVTELRRGEYSNINAIFELHVLNTCLSEAGVRVRVKYITTSSLLYSFLSAFPADGINLEIAHPRHVFMFETKPTLENLDRFRDVIGSPNAFLHAVPADKNIRRSEIEKFEAEFSGVIRDIRSTYSFSPIDSENIKASIVSSVVQFANDHGGERRDELIEILGSLSSDLTTASAQVQRAFSGTAQERIDDGFRAYKEFAATISGRTGSNRVLVRSFGDPPSAVLGGSVPRLVCIPVRGGYRNIFKIYNTSVIDRLHARYRGPVSAPTVSELLDQVEASVRDATHEAGADAKRQPGDEAAALLAFMRAIYAMADREWTLSLNYSNAALRLLGFPDPGPDTSSFEGDPPPGNSPDGRRRLMAQEVLLLQHFAKRGIASNLENLSRRKRWIKLAAQDLFCSAAATQAVQDEDSFETEFNPNSVRQALASVALLIEWMALKEARKSAGRQVGAEPGQTTILPPATATNIAWAGLKVPGRSLESYWQDEDAIPSILADLETLVGRIRKIYRALLATPEDTTHSQEFWRYILVKALSLRLLIGVSVDLEIFETRAQSPITLEDLEEFRGYVSEHGAFVADQRPGVEDRNPGSEAERQQNPFANFLLAALTYMTSERSRQAGDSVDEIAQARDLLSIKQYHYALGEAGFPRSVSQRFLSKFGAEVAGRLRRIADTLEKESHFRDTYHRD